MVKQRKRIVYRTAEPAVSTQTKISIGNAVSVVVFLGGLIYYTAGYVKDLDYVKRTVDTLVQAVTDTKSSLDRIENYGVKRK